MTSTSLDDRLDVVVDPDAEPADLDQALARFLLKYVRKIDAGSTSPAEVVSTTEVTEG